MQADVFWQCQAKLRILVAKPGLDGHDRGAKWWRVRFPTRDTK